MLFVQSTKPFTEEPLVGGVVIGGASPDVRLEIFPSFQKFQFFLLFSRNFLRNFGGQFFELGSVWRFEAFSF
jgi:hypothetical protein